MLNITRQEPGIPEGYVRTIVGVLPDDWSVSPLASLLKELPSYGINAPAVDFDSSLPTYIRITDVGQDGRFRPTPRVSVDCSDTVPYVLRKGDLVLARTGASVGKSYLYDPGDGLLVFAGFLIRISPDPRKLLPQYIFNFLHTQRYWSWIASNSARSGQPGINSAQYGSLPVPHPPLPEQRAIATVLTDMDSLIGSLEAVIAKKRAIKRAAMQQLLTGRTRLLGFEGEWETRRLGDLAHITTGRRNNEQKCPNGKYPFFVRSSFVEKINSFSYDCEAILVPGDGRIGRIIHYTKGRFDVHQRVYVISDFSPSLIARFLYFYMAEFFGTHAIQLSVRATVDSLRLPTFERFPVFLPPLPEQRAIAAVLSDMDAEIAALERRLEKTRAIKRGMMQQLLTGAVRLPIPDESLKDGDDDA